LIWFGFIFLFFSTAGSKLPPYILPAFPAAALLVGALWLELWLGPAQRLRRGFLLSYAPVPVIFTGGLFYLLINPLTRLESKYGINPVHINYLILFMAGCLIAAFVFLWVRHYRAVFSTLAGTVISSLLIFIVLIVPSINPYRSTKALAKELDRILPPGEKLVFYFDLSDSALFYTDREAIVLENVGELMEYLASEKPGLFVIDRKYSEVLEKVKGTTCVLGEEGRKLLLGKRESYCGTVGGDYFPAGI